MSARKFAALVVLALSALSLAGCIKARQAFLVLPDGSGRMSYRVAVNAKQMTDMVEGIAKGLGAEDGGEEEPDRPDGIAGSAADITVEDLLRNYEGFVAFTRPVSGETADGWVYTEFSGYFEDINRVRIFDDESEGPDREVQTSFSFAPEEGGHVLVVLGKIGGSDEGMDFGEDDVDPESLTPEERKKKEAEERMALAMMRPMFKGMAVDVCWTLPGEIVEAGELETGGHTGRFGFTDADLTDMQALKRLGEVREFRLRCGPSRVSAAETEAFRAEMERARAAWEKIRAEAGK